LPSPASSASAAGRFHLHRPGTDVDGDLLTGSLASEAYILKGNVTLHSDPAIDREVADASESTLPLTVTADEIDVDRAELSYIARGHVHFTQGTRSGSSDVAVLNEQRHTLDLIGNADVRDGDHRTTAAKLHYDTASKAFLGAGEVRIYAPLPTPNPSASATPPPKHRHRLPL
jgi:lipopolysaccharide assembly outer membrane protein LptD (OstA)